MQKRTKFRFDVLYGRRNAEFEFASFVLFPFVCPRRRDRPFQDTKSVAGNHWLRLSPSVALLRGQVWRHIA